MRLKVLKLTNFRGIKSLKLEFGEGNTVIYGANGTGKTTIANAVTWLLTGKSVTGEKSFTPKTCGVHKKDHIAEATFVINEAGDERTFKKLFHEKFVTQYITLRSYTRHILLHIKNSLPMITTAEFFCRNDRLPNQLLAG